MGKIRMHSAKEYDEFSVVSVQVKDKEALIEFTKKLYIKLKKEKNIQKIYPTFQLVWLSQPTIFNAMLEVAYNEMDTMADIIKEKYKLKREQLEEEKKKEEIKNAKK